MFLTVAFRDGCCGLGAVGWVGARVLRQVAGFEMVMHPDLEDDDTHLATPWATMRNLLAQLNGSLESLQTKKIDGVTSAELSSGQEDVRTQRRDLNQQADALTSRVQQLHERFSDNQQQQQATSPQGSVSPPAAPYSRPCGTAIHGDLMADTDTGGDGGGGAGGYGASGGYPPKSPGAAAREARRQREATGRHQNHGEQALRPDPYPAAGVGAGVDAGAPTIGEALEGEGCADEEQYAGAEAAQAQATVGASGREGHESQFEFRQGWLHKLNSKNKWNRRWFVLTGDRLMYRSSDKKMQTALAGLATEGSNGNSAEGGEKEKRLIVLQPVTRLRREEDDAGRSALRFQVPQRAEGRGRTQRCCASVHSTAGRLLPWCRA